MKRTLLYEVNHRGKVYTRTFCALLILSVCVVSAFYFSLNRMVIRHHREQIAGLRSVIRQKIAVFIEVY